MMKVPGERFISTVQGPSESRTGRGRRNVATASGEWSMTGWGRRPQRCAGPPSHPPGSRGPWLLERLPRTGVQQLTARAPWPCSQANRPPGASQYRKRIKLDGVAEADLGVGTLGHGRRALQTTMRPSPSRPSIRICMWKKLTGPMLQPPPAGAHLPTVPPALAHPNFAQSPLDEDSPTASSLAGQRATTTRARHAEASGEPRKRRMIAVSGHGHRTVLHRRTTLSIGMAI